MDTAPTTVGHQSAGAWRRYALALIACGVTALLAAPMYGRLDPANISMLFLLAVLLVAVWLGRNPAILAAICSVALFDYFFVPPRFTFAVSQAQYLVTFAVMLVVSLIVSHLTAGLRRQAEEARRRERETRALNALGEMLAGAMSAEQADQAIRGFLKQHLEAEATLMVPGDSGDLEPVGGVRGPLELTDAIAARAAFESGSATNPAGSVEINDGVMFLPLRGSTRMRGVLMAAPGPGGTRELIGDRPLLEGVASLAAATIERLHFVEVAQRTQVEVISERLRNSILAALSHDVRTPLTALYGLADSLVARRTPLPPAAGETAAAIRDQALRLNGMVGNLLDMAKLQAGPVRLRREWQSLEEVIGASIKMLGGALGGHALRVRLPPGLPLLEFDAVLMERVFCNLLENAAKYSPAGTAITIGAEVGDGVVEVSICDAGPGFPPQRMGRLFELFERGAPESAVPGVGVGLAVCRSIVDAHGGRIRAFNPAGGGGCVCFTLPRGNPPGVEAETDEGAQS